MASFALLAGSTALQVTQSLKAGDEAERSLKKAGEEEVRQAGVAKAGILEEQKEVTLEGELATGQTQAAAAGRGLRVGGSVTTQIDSIRSKVARRQGILNRRASEIGLRADTAAREFKRRGRRAKKASRISAFGSLLTGGIGIAKQSRKHGGFGEFLRA